MNEKTNKITCGASIRFLYIYSYDKSKNRVWNTFQVIVENEMPTAYLGFTLGLFPISTLEFDGDTWSVSKNTFQPVLWYSLNEM